MTVRAQLQEQARCHAVQSAEDRHVSWKHRRVSAQRPVARPASPPSARTVSRCRGVARARHISDPEAPTGFVSPVMRRTCAAASTTDSAPSSTPGTLSQSPHRKSPFSLRLTLGPLLSAVALRAPARSSARKDRRAVSCGRWRHVQLGLAGLASCGKSSPTSGRLESCGESQPPPPPMNWQGWPRPMACWPRPPARGRALVR
jgi:hypothetical protein